MEFKKVPRTANARPFDGNEWRLATVDEVNERIADIKRDRIIGSWDIVRLLDGWVEGPGYGCKCKKEYKTGIGEMLLVRVPNQSEIYSKVKLDTKGREASILLSCEDKFKIIEVIWLVLNSIIKEHEGEGEAESDRLMENSITEEHKGEGEAELKRLVESMENTFRNGRTVMHYAADQRHNKERARDVAQLLVNKFKNSVKLHVTAADKYERTALHFAAFHGNTELCEFLIKDCGMRADKCDAKRENMLHFAVNGTTLPDEFEYLCGLLGDKEKIDSKDINGKTVLHKAAGRGGTRKIRVLLSIVKRENIEDGEKAKKEFIRQADLFGGTALHEGARGGHVNTVKLLLEEGSKPIAEQEFDGKTALHYAGQLANDDKALNIVKLLLGHYEHDVERRSLLLWASATGIGAAEECAESSHNHQVKEYLAQERGKLSQTLDSLLKLAIKYGRQNMARELVNRGANPAQLLESFDSGPQNEYAREFINKIDEMIERMAERGRDQPTIEDGLGRNYFAQGLAALFLSPCVKTPVTVGILGDWGMGKSSIMIQTEAILLQTAAQLAFPDLLGDNFAGSKEFVLSKSARSKNEKIKKAVKGLKFDDSTDSGHNALVSFLDKYREQYHEVYRSLALMDRKDMFHTKGGQYGSSRKLYSLENIPTVLTVRYNAWEYQNEHEAWAGLAVEIPKAIEESMTSAQRLRCRWMYVWMQQRNKIYLELVVPCLLALFIAGWVAWVMWTLLRRSKNRELVQLTWGSIPITILLAVWTVVKQFFSVFKPISDQIMGYLRKPDHSENLGYQHQVISDINFSKEQLGEKPSRIWKFIAWLWSLCGLYPDTVKDTSVPKSPPPCKEDIRIIVFVDDLDRCQDTVILKVMSAVSLVLAVCEINVILGMDEKMVKKAITNKFKHDENSEDLAEKYISKIVQLPLALPDTDDSEMRGFLKQQLGSDLEMAEDMDYDSESEENNHSDISEQSQITGGRQLNHVCLNIYPFVADSCTCFSSKVSHLFKTVEYALKLFKNYWASRNPGTEEKMCTVPLKRMLLLPNYSPKEQEVITKLGVEGEYSQRLPRKWKGFLTYHRAAWNILQLSGQVKNYQGWQVQLIVWIFCCWQWKQQMNVIIKKWEKLVNKAAVSKNNEESSHKNVDANLSRGRKSDSADKEDDEQSNSPFSNGLTLGNIVELHVDEMKQTKQDQLAEGKPMDEMKQTKQDQLAEGKPKDEMKQTKQDQLAEGKPKDEMKQTKQDQLAEGKPKDENEEESDQKWEELKKVLSENDVSLDCIQLFQKFRFNCTIRNLKIKIG